MRLEETNHQYYCNPSNYYVGKSHDKICERNDYGRWADFKEDWFNGNYFDID